MRIHHAQRPALWFGPAPGLPATNRFDDPLGEFHVCYLGTTIQACFAETFLRNPPVRLLTIADLAARRIATIAARRELRIVTLYGPGAARLGTTPQLASDSGYDLSQAWSRALWGHPDAPDGVAYRSRHDDASLCIAIYDRARDALTLAHDDPLTANPQMLARLLKRYDLGLTR
ncbi:MAG: RES family NAD+ phosphorylase [Bryobacteraceae bacterium]